MGQPTKPGQIIILNGAPRSGKSSIVTAIQETFVGLWMNLGVDVFVTQVTPKRYRPGMGLRPGGEGHRLAPLVPALYAAMYESIAAHSRAGLNVVVDVGQRDVHVPGIYDLEVDTSVLSPTECADAIRRRLDEGPPPSAFRRLAEGAR